MNMFRKIIKWWRDYSASFDKCEICCTCPYTHVELCSEAGIRVCDRCAESAKNEA